MNMLSWAGIALFVFLTYCLAFRVLGLLVQRLPYRSRYSLVLASYLPKRKPTKHLKLVLDEEDVEFHRQERPRGLGLIGEEEKAEAAVAVALEPNRHAPAVNEHAGSNQANNKLALDQTSEISLYSSDSEEWGSLPSNSSDKEEDDEEEEEEDADGLIEINLPYGEGDDIGLRGKEEDDVVNDNEEDSLIELDISAGFIKTTMKNEQNVSI